MLQSRLFGSTLREVPHGEESKNAILLLRGGYIHKTMAGVYSFLPLGLRVIRNISAIVREEMNALPDVQEVLMPALQPRELWEESGRWQEVKEDVMYVLENESMSLGPTHEEVVTDLFRQYVHSYKELPVGVYQIQTKFRRELRAKSGLLRGREFTMKDLYSFHQTEEDLHAFYAEVQKAYFHIFERCGITAILTEASGGMFSKFSHEFQVLCETGEDIIYLNPEGTLAKNKEVVTDERDPSILEFCGGSIKKASAIEVGNIFPLNHKFSTPMKAQVSSETGEMIDVWMGCYGMGISRLMGTLVEVLASSNTEMLWPEELAPFRVHLLDLTPDKKGEPLYNDLHSAGIEVLYDQREASAGEKFSDADFIGAPYRLIISKRSLDAGGVEYKDIRNGLQEVISLEEVKQRLIKG